jgi:hypothetical protein
MIGVAADDCDREIVGEFFELFKTPWEFYRSSGDYAVLICCDRETPPSRAKLVLIYGAELRVDDECLGGKTSALASNAVVSYLGSGVPIYGDCRTFDSSKKRVLVDACSGETVAFETRLGEQRLVRIGFHLFKELLQLLKGGQPIAYCEVPTIELHIAFVRDTILRCSIPLLEIPPAPDGHPFMACLTHDVDHVGVRNHVFDHTMLGFLYRATVGSVIESFRGRKSGSQVAQNWAAALSLPLVHLGLAKDFWYQFQAYLQIEMDLTSTFFVIPYKNNSGMQISPDRAPMRATRYDVGDIGKDIQVLQSNGREIGLHGIDAWCDVTKGREERARILKATGNSEIGVRMHWLYFDERSPSVLEEAGFSYDSTVGYNDRVGYRAGTTQAFKPLGVKKMLELPMHVMDTALFFPDRMNLSANEAAKIVRQMVGNAVRFGGVVTINWHDRSIAPERLWGDFYRELIQELRNECVWFPTASQAVAWFRKRRSVVFHECLRKNGKANVKISLKADDSVCGLRIRFHRGNSGEEIGSWTSNLKPDYVDFPLNGDCELQIDL